MSLKKYQALAAPLSLQQLRQARSKDGWLTVVIALHWRDTGGDVDDLNDLAEEKITGGAAAVLQGLDYTLVGCDPATQMVYIEVSALLVFLDEEEI